MAQSCLGEQTALTGLNGLDFLYMCKTVDMEFKARLGGQVSLGSSLGSAAC